jgi:hypothetical protein
MNDIFSQVVDPRHETDVTQPSISLLSSAVHDDNIDDLLTATSRSFDATNVESDSLLINNNNQLSVDGRVHLLQDIIAFILSDLKEEKNTEDLISTFNSNEGFDEEKFDEDLDEEKSDEDSVEEKFDEDLNENIFDEALDEDVYEEATPEDSFEELLGDNEHYTDRNFTSTEIALALSLMKARHSLTNSCISNICRLLKLLRVANAPSDFRHVRSLICSPYNTTIYGEVMISCPSCHQISTDATRCSTNSNCINKDKFITNPTINHVLQLEPQIRSIIERNDLMVPNHDANTKRDIIDGLFYHKLLDGESKPFITLLLNSDGAVVKSISRSVWITTFVINELAPSIRFKRENVIIAMVSVGSVKPKKDEMQLFLERLVQELLHLENVGLQYTPFSSSTQFDSTLRVFLIAAVCDKPAVSLLVNHTEAGGYYGCIHCKIPGMSY